MGHTQSTPMLSNKKKGLRKFNIYKRLRSLLQPSKQPPPEKSQTLGEFLDNFGPAPKDWSDVQKVLVVENEEAAEIARPHKTKAHGRMWIVHLCILQSNDDDHRRSKWTFVKLDTQADHSVMFASQAHQLELQIYTHPIAKHEYRGINQDPVACIGWANISFMIQGCDKIFDARVDILQDSHMQGQGRRPPFSMLLGREVINEYDWVQPSSDLQRALHHVHRTTEFRREFGWGT